MDLGVNNSQILPQNGRMDNIRYVSAVTKESSSSFSDVKLSFYKDDVSVYGFDIAFYSIICECMLLKKSPSVSSRRFFSTAKVNEYQSVVFFPESVRHWPGRPTPQQQRTGLLPWTDDASLGRHLVHVRRSSSTEEDRAWEGVGSESKFKELHSYEIVVHIPVWFVSDLNRLFVTI